MMNFSFPNNRTGNHELHIRLGVLTAHHLPSTNNAEFQQSKKYKLISGDSANGELGMFWARSDPFTTQGKATKPIVMQNILLRKNSSSLFARTVNRLEKKVSN